MASEPLNTYIFSLSADLFNHEQLIFAAEDLADAWRQALPRILERQPEPLTITVRRMPPHMENDGSSGGAGFVGVA